MNLVFFLCIVLLLTGPQSYFISFIQASKLCIILYACHVHHQFDFHCLSFFLILWLKNNQVSIKVINTGYSLEIGWFKSVILFLDQVGILYYYQISYLF